MASDNNISSGQIKAVRVLLSWSQEEMASRAGVSINTVRNLELGARSCRPATINAIKIAVEEAGYEFTEMEGIRRSQKEVKYLDAIDSAETLYQDILRDVKEKGCEVAFFVKPATLMTKLWGDAPKTTTNRLGELNKQTSVRCLFFGDSDLLPQPENIRCRINRGPHFAPVEFVTYGSKLVFILPQSRNRVHFAVFKTYNMARPYYDHFCDLWNVGIPLDLPEDMHRRVKI